MPSPPTVLNVAEKPSVARALASVFARLPGARDRGMQRQGNQIFTHENVGFPSVYAQGEGRMIQGPVTPHTMITTSVRGHLASQDFPQEYGWSRCDPLALFDAPIETLYRDDMQELERMLRQLAKKCQVLILWLDCDREGEAIGDEVRHVCIQANPRLQVFRARFSTVLEPEIQRALKSLGRLNDSWVSAVQARSELDLRVGAAFTRFQTLYLQRHFDGFSEQGVVSYGPCQFPTLGFVVERWARIETFRPEDFWFIEMTHNITNEVASDQRSRPITFSWKRGRLYDQIITACLYENCLEAREAQVTNLQGRSKNRWRPVPLATVELQKRASRFLRIGAETLMEAAEQLYQQGFISYPRTETEKFRPEFNHRSLIQLFAEGQNEFSSYASRLLNGEFQNPRAGQHDDQAHPPITPCKAVDPSTITDPKQRDIYKLIVKHYLACCSKDAIGNETEITVRMATEDFSAKGLMIIQKNWLEIYHPWEKWSTGQGELPTLEVGGRFVPTSLLMKEGRTTPPQPISEVELISLMDRNGIGTDATIAQHISTIQDREYAVRDANQKFQPTKLGIALVEGYNSMGYQLNKPDLRREVEAECNNVAAGRKSKEIIMAPILAKMKQIFETARQEAHKLDEAVARHFNRIGSNNDTSEILQAQFSQCGSCRNMMILKQERNARGNRNATRRKMLYCNTCQVGLPLPRGNPSPKSDNSPTLCPICNFQVLQILRGDGYTGNGYHICPKCFSCPPEDHGGVQNGGEFRCFSCSHPSCALATGTQGGDTAVFACPFCYPTGSLHRNDNSGQVKLKRSERVGWFLSCNKYIDGQGCAYTLWLPKEAQTVSIPSGDENLNNTCPHCSSQDNIVRLIQFVWKPGSVPPYMGREGTFCVLCDVTFRREMRIALPQPGQVVARPSRNTGHAGRGRGSRGRQNGNTSRSQTGGRGRPCRGTTGSNDTCYKCGRTGHYANACSNG